MLLSPERQGVQLSKIVHDSLTQSVGTGCFIAVSIRNQWGLKG